ncbi:MAG: PilZ domain-containing protein [Nannocystaceae bacterium]
MSAREAPINPRFVCDLEAIVEVIGRQTVQGLVRDISGSGLCVLAPIPVPASSETNVHLRLVLDWAESETLTLPARTLWLTRTSGHFQIGAAFGQMTMEKWQRLEVLLRFLHGEIALDHASA